MSRRNPFDNVVWSPQQQERLTRLRCMFWDVWHLIEECCPEGEHRDTALDLIDDAFLQLIRSISREDP